MKVDRVTPLRSARRVALAIALGWAIGSAAAGAEPAADAAATQRLRETAATRPWAWRAAAAEARPVFHGVVSYDNAGGGAGTMLYPAPGAAGLLVAILTHAAINEGTRSAEARRIEEEADRVLAPLQGQIDRLNLRDVQQTSLPRWEIGASPRLVEPAEAPGDAWVVETQPVFLLSQDRRALIIETVVRVFDGEAKSPAMERAVRVVSPPVRGEDPESYWRQRDGAPLVQTSAALMAEAIRSAMLDVQAPAELTQRTIRYAEGSVDKFERAMVLSERCDRVAIRTLRGGVMSVPSRARRTAGEADEPAACGAPWPAAASPPAAAEGAEGKPAT